MHEDKYSALSPFITPFGKRDETNSKLSKDTRKQHQTTNIQLEANRRSMCTLNKLMLGPDHYYDIEVNTRVPSTTHRLSGWGARATYRMPPAQAANIVCSDHNLTVSDVADYCTVGAKGDTCKYYALSDCVYKKDTSALYNKQISHRPDSCPRLTAVPKVSGACTDFMNSSYEAAMAVSKNMARKCISISEDVSKISSDDRLACMDYCTSYCKPMRECVGSDCTYRMVADFDKNGNPLWSKCDPRQPATSPGSFCDKFMTQFSVLPTSRKTIRGSSVVDAGGSEMCSMICTRPIDKSKVSKTLGCATSVRFLHCFPTSTKCTEERFQTFHERVSDCGPMCVQCIGDIKVQTLHIDTKTGKKTKTRAAKGTATFGKQTMNCGVPTDQHKQQHDANVLAVHHCTPAQNDKSDSKRHMELQVHYSTSVADRTTRPFFVSAGVFKGAGESETTAYEGSIDDKKWAVPAMGTIEHSDDSNLYVRCPDISATEKYKVFSNRKFTSVFANNKSSVSCLQPPTHHHNTDELPPVVDQVSGPCHSNMAHHITSQDYFKTDEVGSQYSNNRFSGALVRLALFDDIKSTGSKYARVCAAECAAQAASFTGNVHEDAQNTACNAFTLDTKTGVCSFYGFQTPVVYSQIPSTCTYERGLSTTSNPRDPPKLPRRPRKPNSLVFDEEEDDTAKEDDTAEDDDTEENSFLSWLSTSSCMIL